jgi:hypothetical protein
MSIEWFWSFYNQRQTNCMRPGQQTLLPKWTADLAVALQRRVSVYQATTIAMPISCVPECYGQRAAQSLPLGNSILIEFLVCQGELL